MKRFPSWWDQTKEDLSCCDHQCPLHPKPDWLYWNTKQQRWKCRICHKCFDDAHEASDKHLKALSYVQPNIRRPRELSPEKNGCYLEQSWGKDFWTKSVSGESAPGGPYAGAGHHNVTTTPIPGGGLEMKFTISEAEITLARSFLEALLGGLLTASSSRNLGPPPGLGPASEPSPGTPAWPPPPHPPTA